MTWSQIYITVTPPLTPLPLGGCLARPTGPNSQPRPPSVSSTVDTSSKANSPHSGSSVAAGQSLTLTPSSVQMAFLARLTGRLSSRRSSSSSGVPECCGLYLYIYMIYHPNPFSVRWLSRATNWAKFSATATLGVIHRGHVKQSEFTP